MFNTQSVNYNFCKKLKILVLAELSNVLKKNKNTS